MTAPPPILLRAKAARDYLGGADPAKLCPPLVIGRARYWSRQALDAAVARAAGLPPPEKPQQGSAYETWKAAHNAA
jgi:hypothetical protein